MSGRAPFSEKNTPLGRTHQKDTTVSIAGNTPAGIMSGMYTPNSSESGFARRGLLGVSNTRHQSEFLDRPAHWTSSSSIKIMPRLRNQRPQATNRKILGTPYSEPNGPIMFSDLKKRKVEAKAPNSLDRISFQPSWMKSAAPFSSLHAGKVHRPQDEIITSVWPEDCRTDQRAQYDRIDDLSNSLLPGLDDEFGEIISEVNDNAFPQISNSASRIPKHDMPVVNDQYDSPLKCGKRRLRQYGAMLKKVMRVAEGMEARWLNLSQNGLLHQSLDPLRYDLTDPRCVSTSAIDVAVIKLVENRQLKVHYGLEILLLRVEQFCERKDASIVYSQICPHHVRVPISENGFRRGNCVPRFGSNENDNHSLSKQNINTIKPGDEVLGIFRTNTINFLKAANGNRLLTKSSLRVFDYVLVSNTLTHQRFLPFEANEVSATPSEIAECTENFLLETRIVELRKSEIDKK